MVEFIDRLRGEFGVEPICKVLQVAPNTYYAARRRRLSARALRDVVMMEVLMVLVGGQPQGLRGAQAVEGGPTSRA